jgi:Ca-activated chloride channel family protein
MVPALLLPMLCAEDYRALPEQELVKGRLAELEAAQLQEDARDAAPRSDWAAVQQLLARLRELASNSEWVSRVVVELETLAAQKDLERFGKETFYQSLRMRERLAGINESAGPLASAPPAAPYLRRKTRAGKAEQ